MHDDYQEAIPGIQQRFLAFDTLIILRDGKVATEMYSCLINNKISFRAQATIKGLLHCLNESNF